jgi:hypothetical protein
VSATGNVVAGNVNTGILSLTGNIISALNASLTVTAGGNITAVGNVIAGNVTTTGLVSAAGNVTGGNINAVGLSLSGNVISALNVTGNITGANITGVNILSIPVVAGIPTNPATPGSAIQGALVFSQFNSRVYVSTGTSWLALN